MYLPYLCNKIPKNCDKPEKWSVETRLPYSMCVHKESLASETHVALMYETCSPLPPPPLTFYLTSIALTQVEEQV